MEKILFLDFDGILHPAINNGSLPFQKAPDLAALLSQFSCQVVISSSWRFHYSLGQLKDLPPESMRPMVVSATGSPHYGKWPRFNEIKNYMVDRNVVADWRALDDNFTEFPFFCEQLIACPPYQGITQVELNRLACWLREEVEL